jgi:phenylacetic acid degradation operon negative regulatory protein
VTQAVSPKSLILDLLRVAAPRAIPVRAFVAIGALFGLSGNALRVALTRSVAQGIVESDERGSYRLAPGASALSAHVEEWRLGERRVKAWSGAWLACWLPRGAERAARRRSLRALELGGFREGMGSVFVRPDNLAAGSGRTFEKLRRLGLEEEAQTFVADDFEERLLAIWQSSLWDAAKLVKRYRSARENLERSFNRVESLPIGQAAVETFLLGGAAIRILATDPLLPDAMISTADRAKLTDGMLAYDALGRKAWSKLLADVRVAEAPAHLSAIAGGVA